MVCCPFHNDHAQHESGQPLLLLRSSGFRDVIDFAAFFAWIGKREVAVRLAEDSVFPMRNPAMRRQIGSVTTGHSPDKNHGAEISGNGTVLFPGAMRLSAPAGALKATPPHAGCHLASSFCGSVAEDKLHRIPFGYFVIREK